MTQTHTCIYSTREHTSSSFFSLFDDSSHPGTVSERGRGRVWEEKGRGEELESVSGDTTAERQKQVNRFTEKTYGAKHLLTDL